MKTFKVFMNDLKLNFREPLAIWILFAPILIAVVILLISPGVNDSTLHLAMLDDTNQDQVVYYRQIAKVSLYKDVEAIEDRIKKRDDVVGIVPQDNGYMVLGEGNENERSIRGAKTLMALYEMGSDLDETSAKITNFNEKTPPLKKMLGSLLVCLISLLAGMIIAVGIVAEKGAKTIRAINVTTVSRTQFVLGKSLMGVFALIVGIIPSLLILGLWDINWLHMALIIVSGSLISIIVGFLMGLVSSDFIEAAANIKMMMLPMAASYLVYELVNPKWHWTVWWSPFYWVYKGTNEIINKVSQWGDILLYSVIILAISALVYIISVPKIRRGLN